MSNDRHTPDIARTMASAAARDVERDVRRADPRSTTEEREMVNDRQRAAGSADRPTPIFAGGEADGYRTQWDAIQTGFVDEPRKAVQEADALVAVIVKRLSEVFADERNSLEHQWDKGDQVSTEDLRLALRKYRSFFERLLSL
jgi:hypothetical protein